MDYEFEVKSDNNITKKYRLLQSNYRRNVLKEKTFGNGPHKNSPHRIGNMLVNGENNGKNFISDTAFEFAKQKALDKQIYKSLTIDEYRLFNNMLSSMPMCFNLFSDLRKLLIKDQKETSRIVKHLFKDIDWIDKVTYIDVEFIPVPIKDYTEDKSAFDAMVLVEDVKGKKGLISIETKYTDLLGGNTSSKKNDSLKNEIIEKGKFFDQNLIQELKENGYKQIHRNYLLTYAFAKKNKFKNFINVVISPEEDKPSVQEIIELKKHMLKYDNSITKISLEEFVNRGINVGNYEFTQLMEKFQKRYLLPI